MPGFRHLQAAEFIDLLEDGRLGPRRQAHLDGCDQCRARAEAIAPLYEDVTEAERSEGETFGTVDFELIREGIRNALLSRAVRRTSWTERWTPHAFSPGAVWGLAFILLVSLIGSGAFWHYRTAHGDVDVARAVEVGYTDDSLRLLDEAEVLEIEATAWAQTDVFAALAELDTQQEDALRQMITLAMAEDDSSWSQSP